MNIPEALARLSTKDTLHINVRENRGTIKNGQSRCTGNIEYTRHRTNKRKRKPRGQSRMDNPEALSTLSTQDTGEKNVREN